MPDRNYAKLLRKIWRGEIPAILNFSESRAFSSLADYRRDHATASRAECAEIFAKPPKPEIESLRAHARAASWIESGASETARTGAAWLRRGGPGRRVELLATPYAIECEGLNGAWHVWHESEPGEREQFLGKFVSQGHAKRALLKAIALGADPEIVRPDATRAEFIAR